MFRHLCKILLSVDLVCPWLSSVSISWWNQVYLHWYTLFPSIHNDFVDNDHTLLKFRQCFALLLCSLAWNPESPSVQLSFVLNITGPAYSRVTKAHRARYKQNIWSPYIHNFLNSFTLFYFSIRILQFVGSRLETMFFFLWHLWKAVLTNVFYVVKSQANQNNTDLLIYQEGRQVSPLLRQHRMPGEILFRVGFWRWSENLLYSEISVLLGKLR